MLLKGSALLEFVVCSITYFETDESRKCEPTNYVVANEAYTGMNTDSCWWWLRSPGFDQRSAGYVYFDGGVSCFGHPVDSDDCRVRPAMWVYLDF